MAFIKGKVIHIDTVTVTRNYEPSVQKDILPKQGFVRIRQASKSG